MDRPIRLRYDGQIESYDYPSDAWILDRSRDPRENIVLTMPPTVPASLSTARAACVNAVVHNLRQFAQEIIDVVGATLEGSWTAMYFTPVYNLGVKANFDSYNEHNLADSLAYQIASQFFKWTTTPADFMAIMDDAWWQHVVCLLWCVQSPDCTYSFDNFLALLATVHDDASLGDAAEFLRLTLVMLGRKGVTNLGYLKVEDGDVEDPSTTCEPCP